tara:strand:- start:82 stop:579 length:498 start_codon:yes stop_codon:yes gene_type:complete
MMIRKANLKDLENLIKLYSSSIKKMISKKISQWDDKYPNREVLEKDILAQSYYVFIDQNEIIGGITIDENIDKAYKNIQWQNNCFYTIHRLVVKHDSWGIGIGKKLMCFAEDLAKKNNKKSLRLDTYFDNTIANSFYIGLGYKFKGKILLKAHKKFYYCYEKIIK